MPRPREFDEDTVVDRAMELFWTNGYVSTSPVQLATATGIAKGSLYNAFNSKRELFDRALARYDTLGTEVIQEFLARPGSTREVVENFLRFLVDTDVERPQRRGCLAVNTAIELAGHDREMTRAVRAVQEHTIADLAARIQRGQVDGDVDSGVDPRSVAEFLMNTIVGLRVMAKTQDAPTLHRIISSALAVL